MLTELILKKLASKKTRKKILRFAKENPQFIAEVFFTVINNLKEKELEAYKDGLEKLHRAATKNFTK